MAGASDAAARATPVSVRIAESGDLEVTLRASTTLRARERVDVVPQQGGILAQIHVEEGDRVQSGDALAQLDDTEWRLQLEQAEARARAAREAVERARALRGLDLMSDQEVESLASDADVAAAEVDLARLRVEQARIRSPIAGTVTHRFVERGQQVSTSEPAFGVADLDRLEARIGVPERDIARVQVGQVARIIVEEGSPPVAQGRVERIRPVVDEVSGTVLVTVEVGARAGDIRLRPGQFVNVDVVTEVLTDRITLPRTSVLVDGAAPRVYLVRDGRAVEREVTLGYSRGERVEIPVGLEPGDTVVVVGQDNLRPDVPVRIMQVDGRPIEQGPRAVDAVPPLSDTERDGAAGR
jgi:membrane fusion protein, multidrug efflux system